MKNGKIKFNWPLVGNLHIIDFLNKSIDHGKIAGSYIFTGPDNLGKTTVANYFARSLVCENKGISLPCNACPACLQAKKGIHGDITLIKKDKDKKNISVEQIRDFIRTLGLSSFLNSYKIGIIKHAETLSLEAYNALLKTLEEPKFKVVIMLVTKDLEALPLTIISRSQLLRFYPVKSDIIFDYLIKRHRASRSAAKNFSRLCLGRPALAVKFLENSNFLDNYNEWVRVFLDFFTSDVNQRLAQVEQLIGREAKGQESVKLANRFLEIWQGLTRDLMLIEFGQADLVQHQLYEKELNQLQGKFNLIKLLTMTGLLRQAKKYLQANVTPKLVLENIAINV